jgi:hypothetical protein
MELLQTIFGAVMGGGIVYGTIKSDIAHIKDNLKEKHDHSERLARLETKIDLILSKHIGHEKNN